MTGWLIQMIPISCLILLPGGFSSPGIESSRVLKNYQVRIAQESYLVINGFTNINEFTCGYLDNFYEDTMIIDAVQSGDRVELRNAELKLHISGFDCRNDQMNSDFKELLQSDHYPFITIRVLDINNNKEDIQNLSIHKNRPGVLLLSVNINLAGKENDYTLPVDVRVTGDARYYLGHLNLDIRDFGIEPPSKMFGLVKVNEMISIDFMVRIILV